jgi:hypothetical protein
MIPSRTTNALVIAVLGKDYDTNKNLDVTPYVAMASNLVDRVVVMANNKGMPYSDPNPAIVGSPTEIIERWLAAHFYAVMDKPYMNKSTQGASAGYGGRLDMGLDFTQYGQQAQMADYSYSLTNINKKQRASGQWLGTPQEVQAPTEPYSGDAFGGGGGVDQ